MSIFRRITSNHSIIHAIFPSRRASYGLRNFFLHRMKDTSLIKPSIKKSIPAKEISGVNFENWSIFFSWKNIWSFRRKERAGLLPDFVLLVIEFFLPFFLLSSQLLGLQLMPRESKAWAVPKITVYPEASEKKGESRSVLFCTSHDQYVWLHRQAKRLVRANKCWLY